ncbi:MAG TPA: SWIM zinc finger family protein, partial [Candidatus Thermoplasmatota archaeon]|nr:SWIM zinc finger family protein [Candidatus Thermoplasmatota archaeon]
RGSSWWSRKWVSTLEIMGYSGRLERGLAYARQGQVLGFHVIPGIVAARVQGSRPKPYEVAMRFRIPGDEEWERVYAAMSERAAFQASLLAGEMPREIEEAFRRARVRLFPEANTGDMEMLCSCPDEVKPCKHIAAVHYILAQEFDRDPFLLFLLRGRTKDQVAAALRERRATVATAVAPQDGDLAEGDASEALEAPIPTDPASYWRAGNELLSAHVRIEAPGRPNAIPHRLGKPAFWPDAVDYEAWTRQVYSAVTRRAVAMALREEAEAEGEGLPVPGGGKA